MATQRRNYSWQLTVFYRHYVIRGVQVHSVSTSVPLFLLERFSCFEFRAVKVCRSYIALLSPHTLGVLGVLPEHVIGTFG